MIIRENKVKVEEYSEEFMMKSLDKEYTPEEIIFFDLEHYVYKKPKCIGVFGACEYDKKNNNILVTQYMIEDRDEATHILYLAKEYFIKMKQKEKRPLSLFQGIMIFQLLIIFSKKIIYIIILVKNLIRLIFKKNMKRIKNCLLGLKS